MGADDTAGTGDRQAKHRSREALVGLSRRRLAAGLRRQERRGLDAIAMAQSTLCLFILALHLIAQYSIGWASFNHWVVLSLAGLITTSGVRYLLVRRAALPQIVYDALNILDVTLFLWLIWSYQFAYAIPKGDVLKAPSFVLLFVLVAMRALQLHPRPIIVTGATAIVGWIVMIAMVVAPDGANITHNYVEYLTAGYVLLGAETEKLVGLGAAVLFLAFAADRAYAMLSKATHVDDYARAIGVAERNLAAAKAASTAKAEFLTNMSHELRTPMNGVLGMAEVLRRTDLDSRQHDYLKIIHDSGVSLLAIINDILDLSKIEAGKLELDPQPFNLRRAVEDVVTLLSTRITDKPVEVIMRYRPDLPETFIGDAMRIRQIITNLGDNAVKFTPAGHVLVDADGETGADGITRLKITIEDTGVGIPADKLGLIFNKFEQVDMTSSRRYTGTGLGLAISKRLVSMMNGQIDVRSQLDQGSVFWITLDLPCVEEDRKAPSRDASLPFLHNVRALIVDDIKANRDIVAEHLLRWGLRPDTASDPDETIEMMRAAAEAGDAYQLVLLDCAMPDVDGEQLVRCIKTEPAIADAAIILLTSIGQSGDACPHRDIGIRDYLVKPVRATTLLESIARAMAARNVPQSEPVVLPEMQPDEDARGERGLVLVVEDNQANRILCQEMLADMGYRAAIVSRGDIALTMFQRMNPDLVLMDISMPFMDGYETSAALRAIEHRDGLKRTPIVALTAHAMARDRERCAAAGMDDYLAKPMRYDELKHICRYWIAANRADEPVTSFALHRKASGTQSA